MKDWTGNSQSAFATIGAMGHATHPRAEHDYYATEPKAVELLCGIEKFAPRVWEPACGEGHISKVLAVRGYAVTSTDLVDRGFGRGGVDFLALGRDLPGFGGAAPVPLPFPGDIVTNPPYTYATEFVETALSLVPDGAKVAMFLKLTFLESLRRRELFRKSPPSRVWVSSSRLNCGMNGKFSGDRAMAYAWFVWKKGYRGDPALKWFN